jgi:hypothetical protein
VPGSYRVEAASTASSPSCARVTLAVSQTLAIDLTLEVARQSETVSVEATVRSSIRSRRISRRP